MAGYRVVSGEAVEPRGARGRPHYAWVVLATVTVVMFAASGVRSAFGVFIKPLEADFGWDRTSLSAVASLSLFLYGAIGPFVGRLADRWGPRGVLTAAAILLGGGAFHSAGALAFVATALVLAIRDRPVTRRVRPVAVTSTAGS